MPEYPRFAVMPAPRCFHPGDESGSPGRWGAAAGWHRPAPLYASGFFCDIHRRDGDVPLAGHELVERVSLTVEVLFAGAATTLIVARRLGLRAVGIELSEPYAAMAVERLSRGTKAIAAAEAGQAALL